MSVAVRKGAGALKHRVQIQENTQSVVGGEPVDAWTTTDTVWASISQLSGRELAAAQQIQSEVTHRIQVRYGSEINTLTSDDRILFGSRVFDIEAVNNIEEQGFVFEVMCKENPAKLKAPVVIQALADVNNLALTFDMPLLAATGLSGTGYTTMIWQDDIYTVDNDGVASGTSLVYSITDSLSQGQGSTVTYDGSDTNLKGQNGLQVKAFTETLSAL